jgi:hypothetical protein
MADPTPECLKLGTRWLRDSPFSRRPKHLFKTSLPSMRHHTHIFQTATPAESTSSLPSCYAEAQPSQPESDLAELCDFMEQRRFIATGHVRSVDTKSSDFMAKNGTRAMSDGYTMRNRVASFDPRFETFGKTDAPHGISVGYGDLAAKSLGNRATLRYLSNIGQATQFASPSESVTKNAGYHGSYELPVLVEHSNDWRQKTEDALIVAAFQDKAGGSPLPKEHAEQGVLGFTNSIHRLHSRVTARSVGSCRHVLRDWRCQECGSCIQSQQSQTGSTTAFDAVEVPVQDALWKNDHRRRLAPPKYRPTRTSSPSASNQSLSSTPASGSHSCVISDSYAQHIPDAINPRQDPEKEAVTLVPPDPVLTKRPPLHRATATLIPSSTMSGDHEDAANIACSIQTFPFSRGRLQLVQRLHLEQSPQVIFELPDQPTGSA